MLSGSKSFLQLSQSPVLAAWEVAGFLWLDQGVKTAVSREDVPQKFEPFV